MKEVDKRIPIVVDACKDKKAIDIKVLDIKGLTPMADYFIISSGNSTVQVKAIADEVEDRMGKCKCFTNQKEGYNTGRWVLLDYGDIIVHVFYKEDRKFYNIERLWADGEEIDIDRL